LGANDTSHEEMPVKSCAYCNAPLNDTDTACFSCGRQATSPDSSPDEWLGRVAVAPSKSRRNVAILGALLVGIVMIGTLVYDRGDDALPQSGALVFDTGDDPVPQPAARPRGNGPAVSKPAGTGRGHR